MVLRNSLNPPEQVGLVAALINLDTYYSAAPDGASIPYVLLSFAPGATQSELSVDGVPSTWADDLYVTVSAESPGNVDTLRQRVREMLNPGSRGRILTAAGGSRFWLKRAEIATAVVPDRDSSKLVSTGDHPYYAMDSYRVYTN